MAGVVSTYLDVIRVVLNFNYADPDADENLCLRFKICFYGCFSAQISNEQTNALAMSGPTRAPVLGLYFASRHVSPTRLVALQ